MFNTWLPDIINLRFALVECLGVDIRYFVCTAFGYIRFNGLGQDSEAPAALDSYEIAWSVIDSVHGYDTYRVHLRLLILS